MSALALNLGESWGLSFYKPPNLSLQFSSSKFLQSSIFDPVQEWQRESSLLLPMSSREGASDEKGKRHIWCTRGNEFWLKVASLQPKGHFGLLGEKRRQVARRDLGGVVPLENRCHHGTPTTGCSSIPKSWLRDEASLNCLRPQRSKLLQGRSVVVDSRGLAVF